ncbi:MAG: hypothetical protein HRT72_06420, partial [Flavobacteriales bacterium]|nr:hypothetical protein [Flavobacteriales bacterium]
MKKIISLLISLCFVASVSAEKIIVKEGRENIAGTSNNVLTVRIFEGDDKAIMKDWKNMMKKAKGKTSNQKKELFSDDTELRSISMNTIDVWSKVVPDGDSFKLIVGFDLGGSFLNSSDHSDMYPAAARM